MTSAKNTILACISLFLAAGVSAAPADSACATPASTSTSTVALTTPKGDPYSTGSVKIITDTTGGACTASLAIRLANSSSWREDCGFTTWTATATSTIPVDCQGCTDLYVNNIDRGCPLGIPITSVITATGTRTTYPLRCAATPTPA